MPLMSPVNTVDSPIVVAIRVVWIHARKGAIGIRGIVTCGRGARKESPVRLTSRSLMYAWQAGACLLAVSAAGCGIRIPTPVGGRTDAPRVGWVIMSGDADNPDRDFVCQSNPLSSCVVPADRPDARVLGHVYVYYHPAKTETKYTGSVRIGFFNAPHEFNPMLTVKPGGSPGNQSIADFISMKPGTYAMSIAVVATPTTAGPAQNIRDQVSVTVK